MLAVIRAASGVSDAIGIDWKRRLIPCTESVAARKAAEIEANAMACNTISGVRYCA